MPEADNGPCASRPDVARTAIPARDPGELHVGLASLLAVGIGRADAALAHMATAYDLQVVNYLEVALFAGMRPSDQSALRWTDLNESLADKGREHIR